MEVKKAKRAEIESHRGTWLLMGFIAVLAFMFVSFEWAQYDKQIDTSMAVQNLTFDMDMTPITIQEQPLPPPPPAPAAVVDIVIIDNTSTQEQGAVQGTEITNVGVQPVYIPPHVEETVPVEVEIRDYAEIMPEYPGGLRALNSFLAKSIKYPTISQELGSQGRVIVQFVVDTDGGISNAQVVKGIDPHLDKEALRVINTMPKWAPGRQAGKAVRVKYTVPVYFKLQ